MRTVISTSQGGRRNIIEEAWHRSKLTFRTGGYSEWKHLPGKRNDICQLPYRSIISEHRSRTERSQQCASMGEGSRLRGRVVWLTGASRGIGAALAVRLAQGGARLALSARDKEKLQEVKQRCIEAGAAAEDVLVLPLDVKQHDQHQDALQAVLKHFGKLCILVSNAGRSQRARWDAIEISVDRDIFELNVFSLVALARVVNRHFRKNGGGHHVVTSSTAGKLGVPMSPSYTASKHALHGYFEALRIEGSADNIHVTMLCPGPVDSELLQNCYAEKLEMKLNKVRAGTRMSAERCASLSLAAISYKLPEAWICQQPILVIQYILQYCPWLVPMVLRFINIGQVMKLRDGRSDVVPQTSE